MIRKIAEQTHCAPRTIGKYLDGDSSLTESSRLRILEAVSALKLGDRIPTHQGEAVKCG